MAPESKARNRPNKNRARYERLGRLIGFVFADSMSALANRVVYPAVVVEETAALVRVARFESDQAARRYFDAPDGAVLASVLRYAEGTLAKPGGHSVILLNAREHTPGARLDVSAQKDYGWDDDQLIGGYHSITGMRDPDKLTAGLRLGVQGVPDAHQWWSSPHVARRRVYKSHREWFNRIFPDFMKLRNLPGGAASWEAKQDTGRFVMKTADGKEIARASFDIVGTYATRLLRWTFAWANPSVLPPRTARIRAARERAAELGIAPFARNRLSLVEDRELYELMVAAAMLSGAESTYRFESAPDVWTYLVLFDVWIAADAASEAPNLFGLDFE